MVAHSHWQVYQLKFLGFGEWQVLLRSALLCPILVMLRNLQDKHKGKLTDTGWKRATAFTGGKLNSSYGHSKGKMLLHLGIAEFLVSISKGNQHLFATALELTHLSLSPPAALGTGWMHQLDATFLQQQFSPAVWKQAVLLPLGNRM